MTEIKLTNTQREEVLFYEQGFEQYHPQRHIIKWMELQGYKYQTDWFCTKVNHSFKKRSYWKLSFIDPKIADFFILKWL